MAATAGRACLPRLNPLVQQTPEGHFSKEDLNDLFGELDDFIYKNRITVEDLGLRQLIAQQKQNPSVQEMIRLKHFFGTELSVLIQHRGHLEDHLQISRIGQQPPLSLADESMMALLKSIRQNLLKHIRDFSKNHLGFTGKTLREYIRKDTDELASRLGVHPDVLRIIIRNKGTLPRLMALVRILENLGIVPVTFLKRAEVDAVRLPREHSPRNAMYPRKTIPKAARPLEIQRILISDNTPDTFDLLHRDLQDTFSSVRPKNLRDSSARFYNSIYNRIYNLKDRQSLPDQAKQIDLIIQSAFLFQGRPSEILQNVGHLKQYVQTHNIDIIPIAFKKSWKM